MAVRSFLLGLPLAAALFAAVPGCGAAPEEDGVSEPVSTSEEAIKGGYTDGKDPNVVGVGVFQQGYLTAICTGSLLAPNMVLTAHHCVADILNENPQTGVDCVKTSFGANYKPGAMGVTTQATMGDFQNSYHKVAEVITRSGGNLVCGFDQAILVLAEDLDPAEATPLVPRVDTELAKGELYSAVGYGSTSEGQNAPGAGQRRRRDGLKVACGGGTCSKFLGLSPTTEWMGQEGICEGDSGGPAIDAQNRVVGITSRGQGGCLSPIYSDIAGVGQWIKDTALHAAMVGGYAAPSWANGYPTDPQFSYPVGGTCKQPADCASNACIGDLSGTYCTRPCNAMAACPAGFSCDSAKSVCLQDKPPPSATTGSGASSGSGNGASSGSSGGCSVGAGDDPTKPVPWFTGGVLLSALALRRRRNR